MDSSMDSGDNRCNSSLDTGGAIFTTRDFEQYSVFHYIKTKSLRSRGQSESYANIRNENGPLRNENENGPVRNENESGPVRNENESGPVRNENESGPVRNENETEPVRNENGPTKSENGPAKAQDGSSAQRARNVNTKGLATLSVFEHQLYLQLKPKYCNRRHVESPAELKDIQVLAELEERVMKERNRVNEYLYSSACNARRQEYFYIHPEAKQYITKLLKEELQYCIKFHPRYYLTDRIISLLASVTPPKDIPFTFVKVILRLGHAVPLIIPSASNHCTMFVRYDVLKRKFPPENVGNHSIHPSKQHISRDKIAHNLGSKYGADIIISLESLKTLVDNVLPNFEHSWEIPVIVCDDEGASDTPHKCVYVEKPVPQSNLSVRDKNNMYYFYAVRHRFAPTHYLKLRNSKGGGFARPVIPDDIKPVSEEIQAEVDKRISDLTSFEDVCEFSENVCDHDTFGISTPKKPSSRPKVSLREQTPVLEEDKPDIKSVEDSGSASSEEDFEDLPEDADLLRQMKEAIMQSRALKGENSTHGNSQGYGVADVSDLEQDDYVKSNYFAPCTSPLSKADSEQGTGRKCLHR